MKYYDFIKSKSIHEYYQKEHIVLTDKQIVALIFSQSCADYEILNNLEKVLPILSDVEVIRDVNNFIKCIHTNFDNMKTCNENELYQLYVDDCDNIKGDCYCFKNFQDAFHVGLQESEVCFSIYKTMLFDSVKTFTDESNLLVIRFTKSGDIISIFGYQMEDCGFDVLDSNGHSFSEYFRFPYPFRCGDHVKYTDCYNREFECIFKGFGDDEYDEFMKSDYSKSEQRVSYDEYTVPLERLDYPYIGTTEEMDINPIRLEKKG